VQRTRYAIILTLLVTALSGERALMWSGAMAGAWDRGAERSRSEISGMARLVARRWSRGMSRADQQSDLFRLLITKRLSPRRVTLAVRRMVGRVLGGVKLSNSEYRLPPPALA
jgi:hypothetical protein